MSSDVSTLDSMCESITDCPHSTPEWTESGRIVLRNQNIKNGVLDLSTPSFTNEEDYQHRIKRAKPQAGDIVFTREAPMGEVCLIPEDLDCCLGQRQVLLRPKKDVNGRYLFWALQSPFVQQQIAWNEGTGSTVSNVRIPVLKALNIPRNSDEDSIANVLSSLADKIELNRKTNQTLEQIAHALFKSWFVDFEPTRAKIFAKEAGASHEEIERAAMGAISGKTPDQLAQLPPETQQNLKTTAALFPDALVDSELGEVPEGWAIQKLEDAIELAYGKALKKEDRIDGEFPVYGSGGVTGTNKESLVKGPGIIVGRKGTVGSLYWEDKNFFPIDTVFYVVCKENMTFEFSYYLLQTLGLEGMNTDAAVPGLNRNNVYRLEIVKTPDELISSFSNFTRTLRNSIRLNLEGIRSLQTMRDNLLPKLLSGELGGT